MSANRTFTVLVFAVFATTIGACGQSSGTSTVMTKTPAPKATSAVTADAKHVLWTCSTDSDPDYLDLTILQLADGSLIADMGEATGDGDSYDNDKVGLDEHVSADGKTITYTQNSASVARAKDSKNTRGMSLELSLSAKAPANHAAAADGPVTFKITPSGGDNQYDMNCYNR